MAKIISDTDISTLNSMMTTIGGLILAANS